MKFLFYSFFIILAPYSVHCFEKEMTVFVGAGKEDCFHQKVTQGEVIDVEYQVIDGGNLDITFKLSEPMGRILFLDFKKPENNHRIEAQQTGDYVFCFDNSFSSYNTKTVFFEIIVEGDSDEWNSNETADWDGIKGVTEEEIYDMKVQDIQDIINRVHDNLNKAKHYQTQYKNFEARDRNIAEENYFKVNAFSLVQVIIMLSVGIIQVIMVRSLFDDTSKLNKVFRKYSKR